MINLRAAVPQSNHQRIGDVELLRGIAIIFVLIEHLRFNLVTWGSPSLTLLYNYFGFWTGVDLFFAISGFVIARSLLPKLDACSDQLDFFNTTIVFWVRRAWRLLPSAWLWLALPLLASIFFNGSGVFRPFRHNVEGAVAAVFDVANIRLAEVRDPEKLGVSFPYWSLSLEEQFYVLLPPLVFFLRRKLALVLSAAVVLQILYPRTFIPALMVVRTDAILLGVLLAIWSRHWSYRLVEPVSLAHSRWARRAVLAVLLLCLPSLGSVHLDVVPISVGLVALVSAILVFIASYDGDYLMHPGFLKGILLWFGSRSYALYLVHIPAFFLTREIWFRIERQGTIFGGTYTLRFALTAAILLVTFAELNYRFVEIPLRARGSRIGRELSFRTA